MIGIYSYFVLPILLCDSVLPTRIVHNKHYLTLRPAPATTAATAAAAAGGSYGRSADDPPAPVPRHPAAHLCRAAVRHLPPVCLHQPAGTDCPSARPLHHHTRGTRPAGTPAGHPHRHAAATAAAATAAAETTARSDDCAVAAAGRSARKAARAAATPDRQLYDKQQRTADARRSTSPPDVHVGAGAANGRPAGLTRHGDTLRSAQRAHAYHSDEHGRHESGRREGGRTAAAAAIGWGAAPADCPAGGRSATVCDSPRGYDLHAGGAPPHPPQRPDHLPDAGRSGPAGHVLARGPGATTSAPAASVTAAAATAAACAGAYAAGSAAASATAGPAPTATAPSAGPPGGRDARGGRATAGQNGHLTGYSSSSAQRDSDNGQDGI